jgi:hypothetical protein
MPPPKNKGYETKDLELAREEAEFKAEMRQGLLQINGKLSLTLELVQRHDTQIQGLTTNDALRQRDVSDTKAKVDGFESRLKGIESAPADLRHAVDRIERAVTDSISTNKNNFDSIFNRLRIAEEDLAKIDLDKWRVLRDDVIPGFRIGRWVVGTMAIAVIGVVVKLWWGG